MPDGDRSYLALLQTLMAESSLQNSLRPPNVENELDLLLHLPDAELAQSLPAILSATWVLEYQTQAEALEKRIHDYLASTRPPNAMWTAVSDLLMTPSPTDEVARAQTTLFGWAGILTSLPVAQLEALRPELTRLLHEASAAGRSSLAQYARRYIAYIDNPVPSVPESKLDGLGLRSLDAVTTPDEMKPFVDGLLAWLQDRNWPVYQGCVDHLARFPELCVAPILDVLRRSDDADWESSLIFLVQQHVPTRMWGELRAEFERIAQGATPDELEWEVDGLAMELLQELDLYEARPRRRARPWGPKISS
ncbi:DUF5071 domain-containing protein [Mycena chlorophos]|uniref:DUF5071 domain-containing protein n=1 Tax=Mycena chlorophos TaxID=658473 RepID=A0A8H6WHY0_MYCCL|nr:DUF5071 domain-containing protein [Mycena chlorophos]